MSIDLDIQHKQFDCTMQVLSNKHCFTGRKYDKDGDLVNWWSNSSNKAFEKKSQCFVDQYASFEAYGQKVSSAFFTN